MHAHKNFVIGEVGIHIWHRFLTRRWMRRHAGNNPFTTIGSITVGMASITRPPRDRQLMMLPFRPASM